jgi:predicted RNase H-like nuclease
MAMLREQGVPQAAMTTRLRGAATDDVIDALAVLVTMQRVWRGEARVFGEPGDLDAFGYPCAISA